jgi:hypothetical protein
VKLISTVVLEMSFTTQGQLSLFSQFSSPVTSSATGGDTVQNIGRYRIHTFTTTGTQSFTVTGKITNAKILVVAGGGGGGQSTGGGGGAGGLIYTSSVTLSPGTYSVTVGAGGAGSNAGGNNSGVGFNGSSSIISGPGITTQTAVGGGGGGHNNASPGAGGSGGGAVNTTGGAETAGQGNPGGTDTGSSNTGAGGGGAGQPGQNAAGNAGTTNGGGNGGNGLAYDISGTSTYYAGGGGGGSIAPRPVGAGGLGGGGSAVSGGGAGGNGTANTGGGGAGGTFNGTFFAGGNGGSGIVIIAYPTPSIMTGTPVFSQLSASATSSAAGAFSLRAVNGTTAKAVQVTQYALLEVPPVALTQNTFTATGTYNGITNGQYVALSSTYISSSDAYRLFDKSPATRALTSSSDYTIGTGVFVGSDSTVDSTSSTYNGAWLQIRIPGAIFPVSYSVSVHSSLTLTAPYTWKLFGSTTGNSGSWVVLDTQTAYTFTATPTSFTLASTVLNGYTYFRLAANMISPSSAAGNLGPAELVIYGYSTLVSTAQDFYADRLGNLLTAPVAGQSLANWLGGATGYITTWYDQSGNGRNATGTQSTIVKTSNVNQQWAVNPKNGGLSLSGGTFLNGTDFTITCTTKRLGTQGNDGVYGYGANTSWVSQASVPTTYGNNTRFGLVMPNAGSTAVTFNDSSFSAAFSSNANVLPSAFVGATEPTVYTAVTLTNTNQRMYINGTANGAPISTLTQLTANASTGFTIGTVNYYGNFLGEIGELLIFNNALSTSDISTIYSAR